MQADVPITLAGAWRCDAAHSAVAAAAPLTCRAPEMVVGARGERGRGPDGTECVLVGAITDVPRLRGALRWPDRPGSVADLIACGYEELGVDILDALRGSWVAVVWDAQRRTGLLAVDPMAARGLHYAWRRGGLVFGEEARDVLALLEHTPEPDRVQTLQWLYDGVFRPDRALYSGIHRLVGGTALLLGSRAPRVHTYWRAGDQALLNVGREEAEGLLRNEVDRAVARTLGTGRVGVLLSGGLDSSTVAASAVANGAGSRLTAYSGFFPDDPEADERELIEETVSRLGLRHVAVEPTATSALDASMPLITTWKLPLNTGMTFLWADLLGRVVAEGNEVLLDGEGGDELFGYDVSLLLADQLRGGRLAAAWRTSAWGQGVAHPSVRQRARFAEGVLRDAAPDRARAVGRRLRLRRRGPVAPFDAATIRTIGRQPDPFRWHGRTRGPLWHRHMTFLLTDLRGVMDGQGFFRRRCASLGLQPAQPLLSDRDLIELALRIPAELHLHPRLDRPVARAMNSARLSAAVLDRTEKSHFTNPFATAVSQTDAAQIRDLLSGRCVRLGAYIPPESIRRFVAADQVPPRRAPADWCYRVWRLASCEAWLRDLGS